MSAFLLSRYDPFYVPLHIFLSQTYLLIRALNLSEIKMHTMPFQQVLKVHVCKG